MKKKLTLKKQTVVRLNGKELNDVIAGINDTVLEGAGANPCWENLWTIYFCNIVYTCSYPG